MRRTRTACLTTAVIALFALSCAAPVPFVSPLESPVPTFLSSPLGILDTAQPRAPVVPFRLDKPIVAGTAQVSGSGPAGVPVIVADVTFMGEVLGSTMIGSDGKFVISVPSLQANHRIGLALGELAGTPWKVEDFYMPEYQGDESMQVPQVGFFFDTALVQAE